MSIRLKLLLVIGVLIVAFGLSIFGYFALRSQAGKIQSEQATLTSLRTALLTEEADANGLMSAQLSSQKSAFMAADKQTKVKFENLKTLKYLPKMSALIASAIISIQQLQTLLDTETAEMLGAVSDIQRDAMARYGENAAPLYSVYQLLIDEQSQKDSMLQLTTRHIKNLADLLGSVASDFQTAIATIDSQDSLIGSEIQRIETRSSTFAIVMLLVLLASAVFLALLLSNRIVRSVRSIAGDVAYMREGDITRTFGVNTHDEIGTLATDLGGFIASLKDSISNIQNVSTENVRMKDDLVATTEQTSASATEIAANTESINRQISLFDDSVVTASLAVRTIGTGMKELDSQIEEESSMVEESIVAVTAMISSIDSVTKTTDERRTATKKLTATVSTGGEKIHATFEIVNEINDSVSSIEEITRIIEELSSQTNLLAMNAAIEAAHAGDAGRGFSVVADEIRKLAEASSTNSREISRILKSIVDKVTEAGASGAQMRQAFGEIDREVQEVSSSLAEIFANMQELRAGSNTILDTMANLREVSANVRKESLTVRRSAGEVESTMVSVQQVSTQVRGGMDEIAGGIREISNAVDSVRSSAARLGELGESLDRDLTKFRTN